MMAQRPPALCAPHLVLVCGLLLTTACSRERAPDEGPATTGDPVLAAVDNRAEVDSFYQSIDYDMTSHPVAQASEAFMANPFAQIESHEQASSLRPYLVQLETPVRRASRPELNRHDSTVVDSLVTLYFEGGSKLQFYRKTQSGEFLLLDADLRTPRAQLRNGIRVGMSEAALREALQAFMLVRTDWGDRIELEHPTASSQLTFHLLEPEDAATTERIVSRIEYVGYVD